jgi:pilus assembly protein Flp/PilA
MFGKLKSFFRGNSGVTAIEYAVIAAAIIVAIVGVVGTVGNNVKNTFDNVSNAL